jgi:chemotaxis response regulator CheB
MNRNVFRLHEVRAEPVVPHPHIVIAHGDPEFTAELHERFHQRSYSVHLAQCGEQARFLTRRFHACLIVLDTELSMESGWLTCEKLVRESPAARVVLVTPVPTGEDKDFAWFVHATAIVDRLDGADAVLEQVDEMELECWPA